MSRTLRAVAILVVSLYLGAMAGAWYTLAIPDPVLAHLDGGIDGPASMLATSPPVRFVGLVSADCIEISEWTGECLEYAPIPLDDRDEKKKKEQNPPQPRPKPDGTKKAER